MSETQVNILSKILYNLRIELYSRGITSADLYDDNGVVTIKSSSGRYSIYSGD